jgi:hypothetical protein
MNVFEKQHGVVREFFRRDACRVKSVADAKGGHGEASLGIGDGWVEKPLRCVDPILLHDSLAQIGNSLTKFAELSVTFPGVSAELRTAEPISFDGVVDCPMGELRHIKKMKA